MTDDDTVASASGSFTRPRTRSAARQIVTIEKGTYSGTEPAFPSCTNFAADSGGTIYSGTLSNFRSTYSSYANGISSYPGSATKWVQNDAVVYRFTYTIQNNNSAQGLTTGSHSFTWESQNQ